MTGYVPKRGDIVWVNFTPSSGHEQAGQRPALVLSPESYNQKVGLMICCPITNQAKGYPFEVALKGTATTGVVLTDQVKSLDWLDAVLGLKKKFLQPSLLMCWQRSRPF